MEKLFWEQIHNDDSLSAFSEEPTPDIAECWPYFIEGASVLDVGCGNGCNAIFLAEKGFKVDAFDISWTGLQKARQLAANKKVNVNFFRENLTEFAFSKKYSVILCHDVLHLCNNSARDWFVEQAMNHTYPGGYNAISVYTNRLPAAPYMELFTKSLFDVGELLEQYIGWEIVHHREGIVEDINPNGGDVHKHAIESIIARKLV